MPRHPSSARHIVVGDLDNDGKDDVVCDFGGYGLYEWKNNSTWVQLNPLNAEALAIAKRLPRTVPAVA